MNASLYMPGFKDIQFIIVAGLTDVWSAIRKACANRLFSVVEALTLEQVGWI